MTVTRLKLEEFAPSYRPTLAKVDETPVLTLQEQLKAARDSGYAEGFQAGVARAEDAYQTKDRTLDAAILEAISDGHFTRAEAEAAILADIAPFCDAIASTALPTAAKAGFAALLNEEISRAITSGEASNPTLYVHADDVDLVRQAFTASEIRIAIHTDPTLAPSQARYEQGDAITRVDIAGAITSLQSACEAFFNTITQPEQDITDDRYIAEHRSEAG